MEVPMVKQEAPKVEKSFSFEGIMQAFKEAVSAVLGVSIVIYTLYIANNTFALAGDKNKLSDAKDILLLLLSLAGVVVGYYFGRVPAEIRATQSEKQTEVAQEALSEKHDQVVQLKTSATNLAARLDKVLDSTSGNQGGLEVASAGLDGSRDDLKQIRDDLRGMGWY